MGALHRILIVEKANEDLDRLAATLSADWEVEAAASGAAALECLSGADYDLVLLGGIGRGPENEALLAVLAHQYPRPKVILLAPAFCREVLETASILDADGVLDTRDEGEVVASVAAHLGS